MASAIVLSKLGSVLAVGGSIDANPSQLANFLATVSRLTAKDASKLIFGKREAYIIWNSAIGVAFLNETVEKEHCIIAHCVLETFWKKNKLKALEIIDEQNKRSEDRLKAYRAEDVAGETDDYVNNNFPEFVDFYLDPLLNYISSTKSNCKEWFNSNRFDMLNSVDMQLLGDGVLKEKYAILSSNLKSIEDDNICIITFSPGTNMAFLALSTPIFGIILAFKTLLDTKVVFSKGKRLSTNSRMWYCNVNTLVEDIRMENEVSNDIVGCLENLNLLSQVPLPRKLFSKIEKRKSISENRKIIEVSSKNKNSNNKEIKTIFKTPHRPTKPLEPRPLSSIKRPQRPQRPQSIQQSNASITNNKPMIRPSPRKNLVKLIESNESTMTVPLSSSNSSSLEPGLEKVTTTTTTTTLSESSNNVETTSKSSQKTEVLPSVLRKTTAMATSTITDEASMGTLITTTITSAPTERTTKTTTGTATGIIPTTIGTPSPSPLSSSAMKSSTLAAIETSTKTPHRPSTSTSLRRLSSSSRIVLTTKEQNSDVKPMDSKLSGSKSDNNNNIKINDHKNRTIPSTTTSSLAMAVKETTTAISEATTTTTTTTILEPATTTNAKTTSIILPSVAPLATVAIGTTTSLKLIPLKQSMTATNQLFSDGDGITVQSNIGNNVTPKIVIDERKEETQITFEKDCPPLLTGRAAKVRDPPTPRTLFLEKANTSASMENESSLSLKRGFSIETLTEDKDPRVSIEIESTSPTTTSTITVPQTPTSSNKSSKATTTIPLTPTIFQCGVTTSIPPTTTTHIPSTPNTSRGQSGSTPFRLDIETPMRD